MNNQRKILLLSAMMTVAAAQAQLVTTQHEVVDCGQVTFRQPVTAEFKLKNGGNKQLNITDVRTSCGCTTVDYPKTTIAAEDSFTVRATYDAKQMGTFQKQVGLYLNNADEPYILTMRGRVVSEIVDFAGDYPYMLGELKADLQEIEFDDINKGDRPIQRIHIQNPTDEVMEPVVMHLPNYLVANVSPSKIAPHHNGVVTIMLDSKKLRDLGLNQTTLYLGGKPGDTVSSDKEITVSAVLLPDFGNLTAGQKTVAPKIELSQETLNLGAFNGKKKLKGEVLITNKGKETLEISSMQMFTTGLQVSLGKRKILQGESVKLKVTAIASDLQKSKVKKPRILIITNDPEKSKVVIEVVCK